jgi:protein phosphatase
VLAFALPIIVIIGAGIAAIGWYAQQGYFVALNHGVVVVYKGRPGGVLFWDPTVVERTSLRRNRLTENDLRIVRDRKTFDDKTAALAFVGRARGHAAATTTTSTTTTTLPATATTAPGTPTSTAPATTTP